MTRHLPTLLTLLFLSGSPAIAQEEPTTPAQGAEARGAARVLIEQAAFEENHERDYQRGLDLFRQAELAATRAKDLSLTKEAAAGVARCQLKLGQQSAARAGLPLTAYATLQNPATLLYGDRLVPVLLSAIRSGYVFSPDGKRYTLAPADAVNLLAQLTTPAADRALTQILATRDPVLRIIAARLLSRTKRHDAHRIRALRDPLVQVRDAAAKSLVRYAEGPQKDRPKEDYPAPLRKALREATQAGSATARRRLDLPDLAAVLSDPDTPTSIRPQVAKLLDERWSQSETIVMSGALTPLEFPGVEALIGAAERGEIDFQDLRFLNRFLSSRSVPTSLARRVETLIYQAKPDNAGSKRLTDTLRNLAGRVTLERALAKTPSWIRPAYWVPVAYQSLGRDPKLLKEHRRWLEADPRRTGEIAHWSTNLGYLFGSLSPRTRATDVEVLALIELTLRRFGRARTQETLLRLWQASLFAFSDHPTPEVEAALAKIHPILPFGFGAGTCASYGAFLQSPADSKLRAREIPYTAIRDHASLSPSTILGWVQSAHPSQRKRAVHFALGCSKTLGKAGRAAFERSLVARLEPATRVANAELLLHSIRDNEAWLETAKSAVANVSSLSPASAQSIFERAPSVSPEFALDALPRVWPAAYGHHTNKLDRLETEWKQATAKFPKRSLAVARETIARAKQWKQGQGELADFPAPVLQRLLAVIVGHHPRGLKLFREERAFLKAAKLDRYVVYWLLGRVGGSLPTSALGDLVTVDGSEEWAVDLLKKIVETRYPGALDFVEECLRDPSQRVRGNARRALNALLEVKRQEEAFAKLRTGLATRELQELAKLLDDESIVVATGAARALGRTGETA
ncbi:MAG: hypothetical protein JKY65_04000, partial [Planctomycetes bacterium]|nr:hypothetical protein [Planctomycetota bacterium]